MTRSASSDNHVVTWRLWMQFRLFQNTKYLTVIRSPNQGNS